MRKIIIYLLVIAIFISALPFSPFLQIVKGATSYTSAGSGNWNESSVWSPNGVPTTTDDVTIQSGHVISIVRQQELIKAINIQSGGVLEILAEVNGSDISLIFDDVSGCGFSASAGELFCNGSLDNNITITSETEGPSNYWDFTCNMDVTANSTTFQYMTNWVVTSSDIDVQNCTFRLGSTSPLVDLKDTNTISSFDNNIITSATVTALRLWETMIVENLTVTSSASQTINYHSGAPLEFRNSSFNPALCKFSDANINGLMISRNHNDIIDDYYIFIPTGYSKDKSLIEVAPSENLILYQGVTSGSKYATLVIDEDLECRSVDIWDDTHMSFDPGINWNITNTGTITVKGGGLLNLTGSVGSLVTIRSDVGGVQWSLDAQTNSDVTVQYVDVQDSDASSGNEIDASDGTSIGRYQNNLNWDFGNLSGVELLTPVNNSVSDNYTVTFYYKPTFYQDIENASLWTNEGGWSLKISNTSAVVNDTSNNLTVTFSSPGMYIWNVQVWNSTDGLFGILNRTIYVYPESYLNEYGFRKYHKLVGVAGGHNDMHTGIKVYYGNGTDGTELIDGVTWGKVYLDGKCLSNFSDIRFKDDNGITDLDHVYIEKIDSNYALFWVKVNDNLSVNQTIYIYYGGQDNTSQSDIQDTFQWYGDTFETKNQTAKFIKDWVRDPNNPIMDLENRGWMVALYSNYSGEDKIYLYIQWYGYTDPRMNCYSFNRTDADNSSNWTNHGTIFTGSDWAGDGVEFHGVFFETQALADAREGVPTGTGTRKWRVYYGGWAHGFGEGGVGFATANESDPLDWIDYPGNPVIPKNLVIEGKGYLDPSACIHNDKVWVLQAWYNNSQPQHILESDDGISNWSIKSYDWYPESGCIGDLTPFNDSVMLIANHLDKGPGRVEYDLYSTQDGREMRPYSGNPILTNESTWNDRFWWATIPVDKYGNSNLSGIYYMFFVGYNIINPVFYKLGLATSTNTTIEYADTNLTYLGYIVNDDNNVTLNATNGTMKLVGEGGGAVNNCYRDLLVKPWHYIVEGEVEFEQNDGDLQIFCRLHEGVNSLLTLAGKSDGYIYYSHGYGYQKSTVSYEPNVTYRYKIIVNYTTKYASFWFNGVELASNLTYVNTTEIGINRLYMENRGGGSGDEFNINYMFIRENLNARHGEWGIEENVTSGIGSSLYNITLYKDYWNFKGYPNSTAINSSDLYSQIPHCMALVGKNLTSGYWYTYYPDVGLVENWQIVFGDGLFILVDTNTTWQIYNHTALTTIVTSIYNPVVYSNPNSNSSTTIFNEITNITALIGKNSTSGYYYTYAPLWGITESWNVVFGDGLFILATSDTNWNHI